jgi:hypothetical protein
MINIKDIYKGWVSYIVSDPCDLPIAKERAKICSECPDITKGSYEILLPDNQIKEIQGFRCGVCLCPLSTATRSKDYECPKKKW